MLARPPPPSEMPSSIFQDAVFKPTFISFFAHRVEKLDIFFTLPFETRVELPCKLKRVKKNETSMHAMALIASHQSAGKKVDEKVLAAPGCVG